MLALYSIIIKISPKLDLLLLRKAPLKSFGRSIEIWCNFLNVTILVFLAFWQMDGFQRRALS
jgi:hypothetical protein